jgi:pimeloyl-ACP methyl ester carboxylesterase
VLWRKGCRDAKRIKKDSAGQGCSDDVLQAGHTPHKYTAHSWSGPAISAAKLEMAPASVPYLVAGICIFVALTYLLTRPSSVDNASKQKSDIKKEVHESLHRAHVKNGDDSSRHTLDLPDGRKFGYALYGSTLPNAPTIIFIHGSGDNRLSGGFFHAAAEDLDIRIISVDRPGWGLSSTRIGGTVLDVAQDVKYLTSELDIQHYGLIGASGGGPFTLACAHVLPKDQLKSVTMLVAAGPWKSTVMRHAKWFPWLFWTIINNSAVLRRWGARQAMTKYNTMSCEDYITTNRKRMTSWWVRLLSRPHEKDLAIFQDDALFEYSYDLLQENCKRADGVDGMVEDWRIMTTEDLGFKLEDIRRDLPIQLWYGKYDTSVSWHVGEDLKKRLRGDQVELHVREETHLSMLLNCRTELLTNALETMRG